MTMALYKIVLLMLATSIDSIASNSCSILDTVRINGDYYTMANDDLLHNGVTYNSDQWTYFSKDWLLNGTQVDAQKHVRGCLCKVRDCIRLCCPLGHVGMDGVGCVPFNGTYQLPFEVTDDMGHSDIVDLLRDPAFNQRFIVSRPCATMFMLTPEDYELDEFTFHTNGLIRHTNVDEVLDHRRYCLQALADRNDTTRTIIRVLKCFEDGTEAAFILYPIGMLFSVPFLIATFLVYALIPELRNIHGKSLMCYVSGLTVGYISLSISQLHEGYTIPKPSCEILGYVTYFALLISFFWVNVMCIDIWLTFSGLRSSMHINDRKKFGFYSLYAFGTTSLILGLVLLIDLEVIPISFDWRPNVGVKRCFLSDNRMVELIYLYIPMACLLAANLVLFIVTASKIKQVKRETSVIRKGDSKKHSKFDDDKDRFILYFRLFIVMGITWTMEVLSWAVDSNNKKWKWLFILTDICNCVQGVLIFFLFVWKPKVKTLIVKRWKIWRGELPERSSTYRSSSRTMSTNTSSYVEKPLMMEERNNGTMSNVA